MDTLVKSRSREAIIKRSLFNGTNLKIFAAILMLGDHIYDIWSGNSSLIILHALGRMVFPIFLFLAADSFHYTRNKNKYILRLFIASLVMTIISVSVETIFPNDKIVMSNNAFKTFCTAAIYMLAYDYIKIGIRKKSVKDIFKAIGIALLPILLMIPVSIIISLTSRDGIVPEGYRILLMLVMTLPNLLVEGGVLMVLLGVLFYVFREKRIIQVLVLLAISIFVFLTDKNSIQWMMVFAAVPMLLYNGEKGRGLKYFFYIFYPVHLVALYLIGTFM